MIYRQENYFDSETSLVNQVDEDFGLGRLNERFYDDVDRLNLSLKAAPPPTRNAILEMVAGHDQTVTTFWDIQAYYPDDERVAGMSEISEPVRSALRDYLVTQRQFAEARTAIEDVPQRRAELLFLAQQCHDLIDCPAVEELTASPSDKARHCRNALAVVEFILHEELPGGYEVEVMIRHFVEAFRTFKVLNLLESALREPAIAEASVR